LEFLFDRSNMNLKEQDARACSAVLKVRLTHAELRAGGLEELDAAASMRKCFHSLKTEEKTVTAGDRCSREGPNPWRPRGRVADSPPVHQQVCLVMGRTNDDLHPRSTP